MGAIGIFFILRYSPGDPVEKILGQWATYDEIQKYKQDLYLDLPIVDQLISFLMGLISGDLGRSFFKKDEVFQLIKIHALPTIILASCSITISTILGTFMGVVAARKKSLIIDHLIRFLSLIILSFPIFSLAPLLALFFSIFLGILPVSGNERWFHYILPIFVLILPLSSVITRVVRNKFLEDEKSLWVLYLHAKGLSQFEIDKRIIKNALPSIFNVVAIQLSVVLSGTMITETIFDLQGIGSLLFESIQNRDYPIVQGIILYSTTIYMMVYFLINVINEKIDSRLNDDI